MASRIFKGRRIECDYIVPPCLSGVFGKPEATQTNIICIGGEPCHMERLVFDGDCEEEFYEWVEKNGLKAIQKNGHEFFTDAAIAYVADKER